MQTGALGKVYQPGEAIVRQGEAGDCMYVIQEGQVAVLIQQDGQEVLLMVQGAGEFFGEMAIFDRQVRGATVRALGQARVLTVDRTNLLRRITEDPTLAFRLLQHMSAHVQILTDEIAWLTRDAQSRDVRSTAEADGHGQAKLEAEPSQPDLE